MMHEHLTVGRFRSCGHMHIKLEISTRALRCFDFLDHLFSIIGFETERWLGLLDDKGMQHRTVALQK